MPKYELIAVNKVDESELFRVDWKEEGRSKPNRAFCNSDTLKDYLRICKEIGDTNIELTEFQLNAIEEFTGTKKKPKKEGKQNGNKVNKRKAGSIGGSGSENIPQRTIGDSVSSDNDGLDRAAFN